MKTTEDSTTTTEPTGLASAPAAAEPLLEYRWYTPDEGNWFNTDEAKKQFELVAPLLAHPQARLLPKESFAEYVWHVVFFSGGDERLVEVVHRGLSGDEVAMQIAAERLQDVAGAEFAHRFNRTIAYRGMSAAAHHAADIERHRAESGSQQADVRTSRAAVSARRQRARPGKRVRERRTAVTARCASRGSPDRPRSAEDDDPEQHDVAAAPFGGAS